MTAESQLAALLDNKVQSVSQFLFKSRAEYVETSSVYQYHCYSLAVKQYCARLETSQPDLL